MVKDLDTAKAEQLEKKVLELWDRLYQAWMMSNESPDLIGPTVDVTAAYSVWESFKESFGKTPLRKISYLKLNAIKCSSIQIYSVCLFFFFYVELFNMTNIQNFVKENIGICMSVLDSIWSIVKGNMSVILTIFTELFYVILMSGSAVLNFTLSMVIN